MAVQNSDNIPSVSGTTVIGTGTAFSTLGYSTSPTASKLAERDTNANLSSNNFISSYATTGTSSSTTTITVDSEAQQYFTGTATQTVVMPVTSTLVLGQSYTISNGSTDLITVQASDSSVIQIMIPDSQVILTVLDVVTSTAFSWGICYSSSYISDPDKTTYVNSSPYSALVTDTVILVDGGVIGSASSIVLPHSPPQDGQTWTIKDYSGDAATFNITVSVDTSGTIDGASTFVLNKDYQSVSICWDLSQTKYSVVSDYTIATSSGVTISGDSGSISGSSLTIYSNKASQNSGATVGFENSGTTSTLNLTSIDGHYNTLLGFQCGNGSETGDYNVGIGYAAARALTTGSNNVCIGQTAGFSIQDGSGNFALGQGAFHSSTSDNDNIAIALGALAQLNGGSNNCAIGRAAGYQIATGAYNIFLGFHCGINNTGADSNNIYLNLEGNAGESNTLRVGAATGTGTQQLNKAFISGINGVTLGGTPLMVTIDSSTDQLGVAAIPSGAYPLPLTVVTGSTQALLVNNAYASNSSSVAVVFTLPATAAAGTEIEIMGLGAFGWEIDQNASQLIYVGSQVTTTGTGGKVNSTQARDTILLKCLVANTTWSAKSWIGNLQIT